MHKKELTSLIDSFNDKENAFNLQPVIYENIEKSIKIIRTDGIRSYTCILNKSSLVSSTTFIINNFIEIIPRNMESR